LCEEGWIRKVAKLGDTKASEYRSRLDEELNIFAKASLSPYFLIVQDFNRYAQRELGCPRDPGRGSAAGCLTSYLLDITDTDPIKYDLSFARFFNAGRHDPASGRYAMPDIDCDFPAGKREQVLEYIRKKYGESHVAQMATYNELQGREAMTAVLRAHSWGSWDDRKRLTAHIPDKASITDDLQEMMEEDGQASIIRWTLENNESELKEYCTLKDGELEGPLAHLFAQAIRIEGSKRSQGRHPSAVAISPTPLADEVPLIYDKGSGRMITGFDMYACDASGILKLDVLSTRVNDKLVDACRFASGKGVSM
jgi:DNA polymerase III subunit alpha